MCPVFGGIGFEQKLCVLRFLLLDDLGPAKLAVFVIPCGLAGADVKPLQTQRYSLEILLLVRETPIGLRNGRHLFCPTFQISHARQAGGPSLLNNWAMWSGNMIGDSGEIKGVARWRLVRLSLPALRNAE